MVIPAVRALAEMGYNMMLPLEASPEPAGATRVVMARSPYSLTPSEGNGAICITFGPL